MNTDGNDDDKSIEHLGLIDEEQALALVSYPDGAILKTNNNSQGSINMTAAMPFLTHAEIMTLKTLASSFNKSNKNRPPAVNFNNSGSKDPLEESANLFQQSLVDFDISNGSTRDHAGLFPSSKGPSFGFAIEENEQSSLSTNRDATTDTRMSIARRRSTFAEQSKEGKSKSFFDKFAFFDIDDEDDEDMQHDDERLKSKLSEDTFSFLIMTPVKSTPYLTGWAIVVVKIIIYSLILANMLRLGTEDNTLGIPASTEWPIVIAQVIAVGISKSFLLSKIPNLIFGIPLQQQNICLPGS